MDMIIVVTCVDKTMNLTISEILAAAQWIWQCKNICICSHGDALKAATICLHCKHTSSGSSKEITKKLTSFKFLPNFSYHVLNRCLSKTTDKRTDSFLSQFGLIEYFQLSFWLNFAMQYYNFSYWCEPFTQNQEAVRDLYNSWSEILYMCCIAFGKNESLGRKVETWRISFVSHDYTLSSGFSLLHLIPFFSSVSGIVFSIITLVMFKTLAGIIVWVVLIGVILAFIVMSALLW